jgi:hypothetical protein
MVNCVGGACTYEYQGVQGMTGIYFLFQLYVLYPGKNFVLMDTGDFIMILKLFWLAAGPQLNTHNKSDTNRSSTPLDLGPYCHYVN